MNLVSDFDRGPLVGAHYILGLSLIRTLPLLFFTSPGGPELLLSSMPFVMFLLFRKQVSVLSNMMILAIGYCGQALQGRLCFVCSQTHERE